MKFLNKIIIGLIFSIAVYSIFIIISDITIILEGILNLNIEFFVTVIILVNFGWLILFTRWHLLLKNSGIDIPIKSSFLVYMSGFALALIPGEAGDIIKIQILKNKFNIPRTKTSGIIFSEWFYTATGLVILTLTGGLFFELSGYIGIIFGVLLVTAISLIKSKRVFLKFNTQVTKIKFLSRFTKNISESYEVINNSTKGKTAIISLALTSLFWLLESITVYFIIYSFGIKEIEIFELIPLYTSAIILGFISFLPLGTGVVEVSLSGFLNQQGVNISIALTAVIIIRLLTRWYPVLVGFLALKKIGGLEIDEVK